MLDHVEAVDHFAPILFNVLPTLVRYTCQTKVAQNLKPVKQAVLVHRTSGALFSTNYVQTDHEVSTFLALELIGADAYGVLRDLSAPELPKVFY